nr:zinc transporter ZIP1 [Onthophagus taurus]
MELIEAKITAMIVLGLSSLIIGLLPALFTRLTTRIPKLFLSCLLCFGAGVLLSTSLLHLLPEIREDLGAENEKYAELILCCGFFILYFVDEFVNIFTKTHHHHHQVQPQNYGSTSEVNENTPLNGRQVENEDISQLCHIGHEEPCSNNFTGIFSLLLALTIHAVLEGLAVGLENSTEQVLMMLAAVASHKLVVGFCLGAELSSVRQISPCQYFIAIGLFAFGSSLGIGIGTKIANLPQVLPPLLMPILQGLAGGTLLYVTVIEVLPRERAQWHKSHLRSPGILQLLSTLMGFTVMTVLIFYV